MIKKSIRLAIRDFVMIETIEIKPPGAMEEKTETKKSIEFSIISRIWLVFALL